jgi:hypothetical protein
LRPGFSIVSFLNNAGSLFDCYVMSSRLGDDRDWHGAYAPEQNGVPCHQQRSSSLAGRCYRTSDTGQCQLALQHLRLLAHFPRSEPSSVPS